MTTDDALPEEAPAEWWQVPHRLKTEAKLNLWTRISLPIGLFIVAIQTDIRWALLNAAIWSLSYCFTLYGSWMRGWVAGAKEVREAFRRSGATMISMNDLLDLCEEHGVPMNEVADMIWRDGAD